MAENTLYYGDNLDILRQYIKDETIDLIYLDPPFNSNATYNVLFNEYDGSQSVAQLHAFKDTWTWTEAATTYQELILLQGSVGDVVRAFGQLLPKGGLLAYLVMMAPRLAELRRVLKPTGSIYLHCDPTASHYLKVLMDVIFGVASYQNEIIWQRTNAHNMRTTQFARVNDTIFFYTKSSKHTWNPQYTGYSEAQLKRYHKDSDGRLFTGQDLTMTSSATTRNFEWRGARPRKIAVGVLRLSNWKSGGAKG